MKLILQNDNGTVVYEKDNFVAPDLNDDFESVYSLIHTLKHYYDVHNTNLEAETSEIECSYCQGEGIVDDNNKIAHNVFTISTKTCEHCNGTGVTSPMWEE